MPVFFFFFFFFLELLMCLSLNSRVPPWRKILKHDPADCFSLCQGCLLKVTMLLLSGLLRLSTSFEQSSIAIKSIFFNHIWCLLFSHPCSLVWSGCFAFSYPHDSLFILGHFPLVSHYNLDRCPVANAENLIVIVLDRNHLWYNLSSKIPLVH